MKTKNSKSHIKETVDFIYELLRGQEWTYVSFKSLGWRASRIATMLGNRGIVAKRHVSGESGRKTEYKWVASLAPTRVLYDNIYDDMKRFKRESKQKERSRQESDHPIIEKVEVMESANEYVAPVVESVDDKSVALGLFSDQELWDELKRRRWICGNGVLVRSETME